MDAFDYFVVVFLLDTLATEFGVTRGRIVLTLTVTLAFRPVGAIIFGLLSDRYGRRTPLMINVLFFSSIGLLCGFSTNYTYFLILRALYGIGMGGEWGVGASLAMEAAPKRWRGVLSGLLQSGYPVGYLLAAVAARFILPTLGWRWMFWIGGLPALLAIYIRMHVPESEAWKQHRAPHRRRAARRPRPVEAHPLPRHPDDLHDVPLARHPGSVSRLPAHRAQHRARHRLLHRHFL